MTSACVHLHAARGRTQQGSSGFCQLLCPGESSPCSPRPEVRQLSSPVGPAASPAAAPVLELREGVRQQVSLCAVPLGGAPRRAATLGLTQPQSPLVFTTEIIVGTSLPSTGALGWGWPGTPCSSWGASIAKIPLPIFNGHTRVWTSLFHVSPPPVSRWLLLCVPLSCRASVQQDFRGFSMTVVLWFSCN